MRVLTTYGVIMAAAKNLDKLVGAAHAVYKLGYKEVEGRIAEKLSLIKTEKEITTSKIHSTSSAVEEILVKVKNIEKLLQNQESKRGKEGVVTGVGAGGRKKEKDSDGDSHSDDGDDGKNGCSNNRGGNSEANGGGSGGANGGNDASGAEGSDDHGNGNSNEVNRFDLI